MPIFDILTSVLPLRDVFEVLNKSLTECCDWKSGKVSTLSYSHLFYKLLTNHWTELHDTNMGILYPLKIA